MNMRLRFGCQTGLFTPSYTNHVITLHFQKSQWGNSSKQIAQCEVFFPKHSLDYNAIWLIGCCILVTQIQF